MREKDYLVSNVYNSHTTSRSKGKRWTKKKIIVASAVAGVFAIPMAAYAAVELFGFGSFSSSAAETSNLQIVGSPTTANKLVPGQTVGIKGIVRNTNDFPVKVTGIIIKKDSEKITGGTTAECKVSLAPGGTTATFPANGTAESVAGSTAYNLTTPVTVGAGADVWVTVPNVVKQDASATKLCGISADYAVRGLVGSE